MKIFNTDQIRRADKITTERQGISSAELMERAGFRLFQRLEADRLPVKGMVHIFSGAGNNGGDGMVIARYLLEAGHKVQIYFVNFNARHAPDMLLNKDRLHSMGVTVVEINEGADYPVIGNEDIVVDAIFGIGLNRRPPQWVERLIRHINDAPARVVSVDIPSGLYMEGMPEKEAPVVRADHTYTFELPKLIYLLPDTGRYTRSWSLVPIGQDKAFIVSEPVSLFYTGEAEVIAMLRSRERFSHKGTYGHVLVCGGSYGKIGAPLMTSEAALTAGSGLVSALVPRCGYQVLQTAVPEVMCIPVMSEEHITEIVPGFDPDVVAIGPGLGTHPETFKALKHFMSQYRGSLVLDADALNLIAMDPGLWAHIHEHTVITPHPGEFRRLAGDWGSDREMLEKAVQFAREKKIVVVLKGAYTLVTDGRCSYFNSTGNSGMATGGSGDVLTGIIASLLGQGYTPVEAARLGVYIHGLAADIAIRQTSQWSLTATDIIDFLGDAFLHLSALKR